MTIARTRSFCSRALRQLPYMSFDWFSVFSVSAFVIVQSVHFGFDLTKFNRKLLNETKMFLLYNFARARVSPRISFSLFYAILLRGCHYSSSLFSVVVRQ